MEINNVATITSSENQELDEKKLAAEGDIPNIIFAPIKKRMKLIPYLRKRNMVMMFRNAKNREISPITANTLEEMANNYSSCTVRSLSVPTIMTPIMAGIESIAKMISVEPMISNVSNMCVICLFPFILVKKCGVWISGSTEKSFT